MQISDRYWVVNITLPNNIKTKIIVKATNLGEALLYTRSVYPNALQIR